MIRYLVSARMNADDLHLTLLGSYFLKEKAIARFFELTERYGEATIHSKEWEIKASRETASSKADLN